ncbi:MAG: sulfite reductase subunit alpha [Pseudomonadota bacterium]
MNWPVDTLRPLCAAGLVLAYAGLCLAIGWGRLARVRATAREARALATTATGAPPLLVLFASQTGYAERLARQTAQALHAAGEPVRLLPLAAATAPVLRQARKALLLLSTYGEGDAPDNGAAFLDTLARLPPVSDTSAATAATAMAGSLGQLHYGVLALGDSSFRHFCGFGRAADAALAARGARPLFPRIDMDRGAESALLQWQDALAQATGTAVVGDWTAPAWEAWTFAGRRWLNPGSQGGPVFLVRIVPPAGTAPVWEAGDLVELCPPGGDGQLAEGEPAHPRDYSIASLSTDGALELVVRRTVRADGSPGRVSGWLTAVALAGDPVPLRLRTNRNFRLGDNAARPLVLVGNGTGIAGLRGHLRARAAAGLGPNWLVFGERQAAHDVLLGDEIAGWQASGVLARVDLVFSRDGDGRNDGAARPYVQQRLREVGDTLRQWAADGAAVYVCGSLAGMAPGVDAALREVLGTDTVDALAAQGRYRRDVY